MNQQPGAFWQDRAWIIWAKVVFLIFKNFVDKGSHDRLGQLSEASAILLNIYLCSYDGS